MKDISALDAIDTLHKYLTQCEAVLDHVLDENFLEKNKTKAEALWIIEDRLKDIREMADVIWDNVPPKNPVSNKAA